VVDVLVLNCMTRNGRRADSERGPESDSMEVIGDGLPHDLIGSQVYQIWVTSM
jgi:hypothetical protein